MNPYDKFYSQYVSSHASFLYGEPSIAFFRRQFGVWESYFGRFLPLDKNAFILDVGCGNGGFLFWLKEKHFLRAAGVEISKEQVDVATGLGIQNIFQADFREFLKDKKDAYDVVFARDVLEHFPSGEVDRIIELVAYTLRRGGQLIIQTVNAENLLWGRLRHGDFTHQTAFTATSIKQLLAANGFDAIGVYPQRPVVQGVKSLIRFLLWKFFEVLLKFYLLAETGSSRGIFTQNIIVVARKH